MKHFKYSIAILIAFFTISCEEVIDVNLNTAPPKLVIEASINWVRDTPGNVQSIKLSTTTDYFANEVPPVTDALVSITNSEGTLFVFTQVDEPGLYICTDFVPVVNENYTLVVIYDGETFTSTEKLLATPEITRVEQRNDGGFLGDEIEVKFFFNDIPDETNFYFLGIKDPNKIIPEYNVIEDRLFENNEMFGLYSNPDFVTGDTLVFTVSSISLQYFNYMNILLAQTGNSNTGPFSTPNSTLRGNIVNQTNFDNFALGYFRLSETVVEEYIIE